MFGLGWFELLVIAGAIALIAGPVALRRVLRGAQELHQAKQNLTGPRAIQHLLGGDDDPPPGDEEPDEPR